MPLVFRTTGAWGTGKGSGLTTTEIDNNFHELNRDKLTGIGNTGSITTTKFLQTAYPVVAPTKISIPGTGALGEIETPISTGASTSPTGVVVDPTGKYVYVINSAGNSIGQFSINQATGVLTSISTALSTGASSTPYGIATHPNGKHIYVSLYGNNTVSVYDINQVSGALAFRQNIITSVPNGQVGNSPYGLVVDPTGKFLYVSCYASSIIHQYSIDQTNGTLTSVGTVAANTPSGIVIDPSNRFLYSCSLVNNAIIAYRINQTTGVLTPIASELLIGVYTVGSGPEYIVIDPSGRFLYASLSASPSNVRQFTIDQTTGDISLTPVVSTTAFTNPIGIAIDPSGRFTYVTNGAANGIGQFVRNNFSLGSGRVSGSLDVGGSISSTTIGTGTLVVNSANISTSTSTGALTVAGGIGIGKDIWVSGNIQRTAGGFPNSSYHPLDIVGSTAEGYVVGSFRSLNVGNQSLISFWNPTSAGDLINIGSVGTSLVLQTNNTTRLSITNAGNVNIAGELGVTGRLEISGTTSSNFANGITLGGLTSTTALRINWANAGYIGVYSDTAQNLRFVGTGGGPAAVNLVTDGNITAGGTLQVSGNITATSALTVNGLATFSETCDTLSNIANAAGAVTHDFSQTAVWYHTNITSNFTANFTNVPTTDDRTIVCTLILVQGSVARIPTAVQIGGVAQTILWQGGQPIGTSNKTEIVSFTLIRRSSTWVVLGSLATFG